MTAIWVLVADSSRAQLFFASKPNGDLHPVKTFTHHESRLHERELTSDLPGRAFDSGGMGRHAMGQGIEPKQQLGINFAKQLASHLESGRKCGKYDRLYVVATPAFLGLLRKEYSPDLASMLATEIDKDFTRLNPAELRKRLPEYL